MLDFSSFIPDSEDTEIAPFSAELLKRSRELFTVERYADINKWHPAYQKLIQGECQHYELGQAAISLSGQHLLSPQELGKQLKELHPWRKGPFDFFGQHIDTEWRSDIKWDRLQPHISDLNQRLVLDIGCGSGYHCWRMRGAGAKFVLGVDPSPKFVYQFHILKHFMPMEPVHLLPLRSEDLPKRMGIFDTVFSMGVLYHRRSPFEHLDELKQCLRPGGELVLETLVVDGDENTVLVPKDRYAQMRNVWCLPSPRALALWLEKLGFADIRCVDVSTTNQQEQRQTDWMWFHSLQQFLDPQDQSKTLEGLPAPKRAILIARRP